jgi:hypothetical protein
VRFCEHFRRSAALRSAAFSTCSPLEHGDVRAGAIVSPAILSLPGTPFRAPALPKPRLFDQIFELAPRSFRHPSPTREASTGRFSRLRASGLLSTQPEEEI